MLDLGDFVRIEKIYTLYRDFYVRISIYGDFYVRGFTQGGFLRTGISTYVNLSKKDQLNVDKTYQRAETGLESNDKSYESYEDIYPTN